MLEYIYLLHPYRHAFFDEPTPEEQAAMNAHFEYLNQACGKGVVLLAGTCQDETFEMVVFKAENEEAAQAFMYNDPSVRLGVMMAELHPMEVSLRLS